MKVQRQRKRVRPKSKYRSLLGRVIHVPATEFSVEIPGMFYRAKVVKRDPSNKACVVVRFLDTDVRFPDSRTQYFWPVDTVLQWQEQTEVRGVEHTTSDETDAFAADLLALLKARSQESDGEQSKGPRYGKDSVPLGLVPKSVLRKGLVSPRLSSGGSRSVKRPKYHHGLPPLRISPRMMKRPVDQSMEREGRLRQRLMNAGKLDLESIDWQKEAEAVDLGPLSGNPLAGEVQEQASGSFTAGSAEDGSTTTSSTSSHSTTSGTRNNKQTAYMRAVNRSPSHKVAERESKDLQPPRRKQEGMGEVGRGVGQKQSGTQLLQTEQSKGQGPLGSRPISKKNSYEGNDFAGDSHGVDGTRELSAEKRRKRSREEPDGVPMDVYEYPDVPSDSTLPHKELEGSPPLEHNPSLRGDGGGGRGQQRHGGASAGIGQKGKSDGSHVEGRATESLTLIADVASLLQD